MQPISHAIQAGAPYASDELTEAIERQIEQATSGQITGLRVDRAGASVTLHGSCRTYHVRELADHAALDLTDGEVALTNMIRVR